MLKGKLGSRVGQKDLEAQEGWRGEGLWTHPLEGVPCPTLRNPLWLLNAVWCRPGNKVQSLRSQSSVASSSFAIRKMGPNLFLNSLRELYLSFCPEPLDKTRNLTYICVLWLLLLLFCFLVGIPSTPTCWENGCTQKVRNPEWAPTEILYPCFHFYLSLVESETKMGCLKRD